ncbi:hypothetical protein TUSST3_63070 [Streptomyces sp. TUS-ST3]|nr:hypothetical protein TUSST3_63070 [Streptomyces sp. TUS-ST3]
MVTPGARNFSGASRKEIASTIPSHTKVTALAVAADVAFIQPTVPLARFAHAVRCPRDCVYP